MSIPVGGAQSEHRPRWRTRETIKANRRGRDVVGREAGETKLQSCTLLSDRLAVSNNGLSATV